MIRNREVVQMNSSSLRPFSVGLFLLALGPLACGGGDNSKGTTDGGAGATAGSHGGQGGTGATAGSHGGQGGAGATAGSGVAGQGGNSVGGGQGGGLAGAGGAAGGGGAKTDGGAPDLSGITPPAMLTATVLDRRATTFELVWTAPSNGGASVSGYQIRYAKVPITTTNFDDTTVTTASAYSGSPKAPRRYRRCDREGLHRKWVLLRRHGNGRRRGARGGIHGDDGVGDGAL